MLIGGILLGLLLGLLVGGSLANLASVRLRLVPLIAAAVGLRYGTEVLLGSGVPLVEVLRVPLLGTAFGLLLAGLWANRTYPGMTVAFVGILANAIVIVVNGGHMPVWAPSLVVAGLSEADVATAIHVVFTVPGDFLLHLGPLGDVIPIPIPLIRNVASVGDLFVTAGLAFFLFASVVGLRPSSEEDVTSSPLSLGHIRSPAGETGLSPSLAQVAALQRPLVLGGRGTRLATSAPFAAIPAERPELVQRVRRHPYIRLALNPAFSALWVGQLVSLFGDRVHQIALAAIVLATTGSGLATAMTFFAAALPNLFLSPIAGTLVDRWDRKEVLIVSDILRAAIVLLIPLAVVINIVLVYPLIFIANTISVFFRPARVAILPQLVRDDELVTANSAMWVGETVADVVGLPLVGVLVFSLREALPLAFWLDAATYLASAVMLASIVARGSQSRKDENETNREGFIGELKEGWRFLRGDKTLLANTVQATIAQFSIGVMIALTPLYAFAVFPDADVGWEAIWSFILTAEGLGNLLGGFLVGLVGSRIAKGRMIIGGYAAYGLLIFLLAATSNVNLALGVAFGSGIANMVFIIPSQALFQQRTPAALMGRVVSFRFAMVFGSMAIAMGIGGLLAEVVGVTTVIGTFGLVTLAAGLAGLLVPEVRDA